MTKPLFMRAITDYTIFSVRKKGKDGSFIVLLCHWYTEDWPGQFYDGIHTPWLRWASGYQRIHPKARVIICLWCRLVPSARPWYMVFLLHTAPGDARLLNKIKEYTQGNNNMYILFYSFISISICILYFIFFCYFICIHRL